MLDHESPNPFCTRFFQPGAVPFYFDDGISLTDLVARWLDSENRLMAIVGPHGTGKSTLVTHILRHCDAKGIFARGVAVQFRTQERMSVHGRRLLDAHRTLGAKPPALLAIDGYEQLRGPLRWLARRIGSIRSRWLLITSHTRERHFSVLWETRMTPQTEAHVLHHLLQGQSDLLPETMMRSQAWSRSRTEHGDNLRETLFDMYDWYRDRVDAAKQGG